MADQVIDRLLVRVGADLKELNGLGAKIGAKFKAAGAAISSAGAAMTRNLTLPIAAAGVGIIKVAGDFEESMTKLNTQVGVSMEQVGEWGKQLADLAPVVGIAPKELADALFVVTSAGADAADAIGIVERAAKASAIGLGETADIARAVTSAMTAYKNTNLTAAEATDKLLAIVKEGNLEASQLAGSLGKVIPIASSMGISFDEVGANIATFTRLGVTASEAVTGLKGTLTALQKPTKEAMDQAEALGTSFEELRKSAREKGLAATLQDLIKLTGGNETALVKMIPQVEALASVLGTAGSQGEAYKEVLQGIKTSNESVDEGFATVTDTINQQMRMALASIKVLFIEIANSGILGFATEMIKKFTAFVSVLIKTNPETFRLGIVIAGVAAAMGPLLFIAGKIVSSFGTLISVGSKLFLLFNPWVLAAAALAAAAFLVIDNWSEVIAFLKGRFEPQIEKFKKLWTSVKTHVKDMLDAIIKAVKTIFDSIRRFWLRWGDDIKTMFAKISTALVNAFVAAFNFLSTVVTRAFNAIRIFWERWGDDILNLLGGVMMLSGSLFVGALNAMTRAFETWDAIFKGEWESAWTSYKEYLAGIWTDIGDIVRTGLETITPLVAEAGEAFLNLPESTSGIFDQFIEDSDKAKKGVKGVGEGAREAGEEVTFQMPSFEDFRAKLAEIKGVLGDSFSGLIGGLSLYEANVRDAGTSTGDAVTAVSTLQQGVSSIHQPLLDAWDAMGLYRTATTDAATATGDWEQMLIDAKAGLLGVHTGITSTHVGMLPAVKKLTAAIEKASPFESAMSDIVGILGTGTGMSGILSSLASNFIPGVGTAIGAITGILTTFGVNLGDIGDQIAETFIGVLDFLTFGILDLGGGKSKEQKKKIKQIEAMFQRIKQAGGGPNQAIQQLLGENPKLVQRSGLREFEFRQLLGQVFGSTGERSERNDKLFRDVFGSVQGGSIFGEDAFLTDAQLIEKYGFNPRDFSFFGRSAPSGIPGSVGSSSAISSSRGSQTIIFQLDGRTIGQIAAENLPDVVRVRGVKSAI